jgi:hypothetical protein
MTDSVEIRDKRLNLVVSFSELKAIDDWCFAQRIHSRSDAIRRLIVLGLEASQRQDGEKTVSR